MYKLDKKELLAKFRNEAERYVSIIQEETTEYKKRADLINKVILKLSKDLIRGFMEVASQENWTRVECLESILLTNYVTYVVMLEFRNRMWGYDYMAFSRRIGELWEPFCKLPFLYPINDLELYDPCLFSDIKVNMQNLFKEHVLHLNIQEESREELFKHYDAVWDLVESGGIQLGLDLHFKMGDTFYNVDYKSGFSSNEKGNTNRLLLVASIYHSLLGDHRMMIFVRQKEEDNNHYLQTLKKSPYWEVYCADEAYEKIREFSGFDLKLWMNNNMDWENDISAEFKDYLNNKDLLKYLTW